MSRAYGDVAEMIVTEASRADGVEAVIIVTPNHLHAPQALQCIKAGLDVICEKPLTRTLTEAIELVDKAASRVVLAVTHTYTGFDAVRQARAIVASGTIGTTRIVQVEYPQDWLADPVELTGNTQAEWRTDPERAGAGCAGDIGTHAFNLVEFVSGAEVREVVADITANVNGRRLDDNVNALLRFSDGTTGMLWASQIARGHRNDLRLRIYGSEGSIEWSNLDADALIVATASERRRHEAVPDTDPDLQSDAAFANIYRDAAEHIRARRAHTAPSGDASMLQLGLHGARAVAFVEAVLESSRTRSWVRILPSSTSV